MRSCLFVFCVFSSLFLCAISCLNAAEDLPTYPVTVSAVYPDGSRESVHFQVLSSDSSPDVDGSYITSTGTDDAGKSDFSLPVGKYRLRIDDEARALWGTVEFLVRENVKNDVVLNVIRGRFERFQFIFRDSADRSILREVEVRVYWKDKKGGIQGGIAYVDEKNVYTANLPIPPDEKPEFFYAAKGIGLLEQEGIRLTMPAKKLLECTMVKAQCISVQLVKDGKPWQGSGFPKTTTYITFTHAVGGIGTYVDANGLCTYPESAGSPLPEGPFWLISDQIAKQGLRFGNYGCFTKAQGLAGVSIELLPAPLMKIVAVDAVTGVAVSDVEIFLRSGYQTDPTTLKKLEPRVEYGHSLFGRTTQDGSVSLPVAPGPFFVTFNGGSMHEGRQSVEKMLRGVAADDPAPLTIKLQPTPGANLAGKVQSDDGNLLSEVELTVVRPSGLMSYLNSVAGSATERDGSYAMRVPVEALVMYAVKNGYATTSVPVDLRTGPKDSMTMVLKKTGPVKCMWSASDEVQRMIDTAFDDYGLVFIDANNAPAAVISDGRKAVNSEVKLMTIGDGKYTVCLVGKKRSESVVQVKSMNIGVVIVQVGKTVVLSLTNPSAFKIETLAEQPLPQKKP